MTTKSEKRSYTYFTIGMLTVLLVLLVFQGYQIAVLSSEMKGIKAEISSPSGEVSNGSSAAVNIMPKGVPVIYGPELKISYDDISQSNPAKADATIDVLAKLDTQIKLNGTLLQRYISTVGSISCEYCCGAASIIFTKDSGSYKAGDAACGCAHSYAMRGLAKYLLLNHANEYTDAQILEELGKWKTLFFPEIMAQKAKILQESGIELNYINLASNKYRGIEQSSSSSGGGGMVGGC